MSQLSLLKQASPLSDPSQQRAILEAVSKTIPTFEEKLSGYGNSSLQAAGIQVLQINVGKLCNQVCRHCHVDAGPDRRESMTRETAEAIIRLLETLNIKTLDITGGAPEMNPNFQWLVQEAKKLECHVIDRCNLTILVANGFKDLPAFLAKHQVEVVASLPCYLEENCDAQRGNGVFQQSIQALKCLNELGYGNPDSSLSLTLVYNPIGATLPPDQEKLEADFREELRKRYGIEFTQLYTITNLPISRFLDELLQTSQYEIYMQKLVDAFNPSAAANVMCRNMLSVDWKGNLYDCDFNQMLELPLTTKSPQTVFEFDLEQLSNRMIATGRHCYGCTAGAGSGCQGSLIG